MNVFIVDDEPHAMRTVEALLKRQSEDLKIKIVGMSNNAKEAIVEINKHKPEVLFLDIEMPEMNGFELLSKIEYENFLVVFVTAYRDYAVEAFSVNAFHYLVKPISPLAFKKCVENVKERLDENSFISNHDLNELKQQDTNKLALKAKEGYHLLDYKDIVCVESDGGYSKFSLKNGKHVLQSKNLKQCSTMLPHDLFLRISRSAIVSLDKISSFNFHDGGSITLSNNEELMVGKTYRSEVFKLLRSQFVNRA